MDNIDSWLVEGASSWVWVCLSTLAVYSAVVICVRIVGLRSFSKMSSTDFVTTLAVASLMATTIGGPSPSLAVGLLALLSIFFVKWAIAIIKRKSRFLSTVLDNSPLCLMRGTTILEENLTKANVSRSELHAKLREANVWSYDQVIHVVFESTGDISVLHKAVNGTDISRPIFDDVHGI